MSPLPDSMPADAPPPDLSTRRALLERLKTRGPETAQALAGTLGVTPMAVRQHLYALEGEGLVAWTADAGTGRGRPNKVWALTGAASRLFPDAHQELAVSLLSAVRQALGEAGFAQVLAQREADQIAAYRRGLPDSDLAARVAALAALRTREGYMAEALPDGYGGCLLIENHCPVCSAARACSGICAGELAVFRAVLGDGVSVERTDHILAGARRCAYRVRSLT